MVATLIRQLHQVKMDPTPDDTFKFCRVSHPKIVHDSMSLARPELLPDTRRHRDRKTAESAVLPRDPVEE